MISNSPKVDDLDKYLNILMPISKPMRMIWCSTEMKLVGVHPYFPKRVTGKMFAALGMDKEEQLHKLVSYLAHLSMALRRMAASPLGLTVFVLFLAAAKASVTLLLFRRITPVVM